MVQDKDQQVHLQEKALLAKAEEDQLRLANFDMQTEDYRSEVLAHQSNLLQLKLRKAKPLALELLAYLEGKERGLV